MIFQYESSSRRVVIVTGRSVVEVDPELFVLESADLSVAPDEDDPAPASFGFCGEVNG